MKIEILTKRGIKNTFDELSIQAERAYWRTEKPYYEVWLVEKQDLKQLEEARYGGECAWFGYAKGCNLGTPFEFLTIKGQFIIGWTSVDRQTEYDTLLDYFKDGLGVVESDDVCSVATALARANGMTMTKLFKMCQG
jgi:hypothetical protein